MKVYRLARKIYGASLSAKGSALRGGRWNSKGTEVIYTSDSRALAMAEVAVYLSLENLPDDYIMLCIEIDQDVSISAIDQNLLPGNWNEFPHIRGSQKFGDLFVSERKYCVLKVPSAVVPGDFNYLINPVHKDFEKISISEQQDFPFDRRIF